MENEVLSEQPSFMPTAGMQEKGKVAGAAVGSSAGSYQGIGGYGVYDPKSSAAPHTYSAVNLEPNDRFLRINWQALIGLTKMAQMNKTVKLVGDPLPDDATFRGAVWDYHKKDVMLIVRSKEFSGITDTELPGPRFTIVDSIQC